MFFGWLLLTFLTALAGMTAIGIAVRTAPAGRSELGITAMLSFFALVGAPVLLLGYTNFLTATNLAAASFLLFTGISILLARGRGLRAHLRACGDAAVDLVAMPFVALRETLRARSLVALGLLCTALLIGLAALFTYLIGFGSWDGFAYHEPMVGYAIQNHGFSMVPLPPIPGVASTNSYPRLCESVSLWFVIFTDRTFIELPQTLAAPPLMWCVYALSRRYADRITSMGWAVVLLLMPHSWHGLCSTYIDEQVGFFTIAAMYFASRPDYRIRDSVLATLAMALMLASKGSSLVMAPPIALIAYGRLIGNFARLRARPRATLGSIVLGVVALAGIASITLVRNWLAFRNPLWPVAYDFPALGIKWNGLIDLETFLGHSPTKDIVDRAYEPPQGGAPDIVLRGYGFAIAWIVAPLGVVGLVCAAVLGLLELLRLKTRGHALNLAMVAFPGLVALKTTPSLNQPRYNMHIVVVLFASSAWLLQGRRLGRLREGLVAAAIVLSILPFFWVKDAHWTGMAEMEERLLHPFAPRAYSNHPTLDQLARERYVEILPGDRVVYTQEVSFIGALWNFDFSNRVDYIPFESTEQWMPRIRAHDPKWVSMGESSPARAALELTGEWEHVGKLSSAQDSIVLRRKASPR